MRALFSALVLGMISIALLPMNVSAQEHGDLVERSDDSNVMGVSEENALMNAAIQNAVENIDVFFDALETGNHPRETFMLKILTETAPEEFEHMWYIFVETSSDDKVSGILTHNPYAAGSEYKAGEVYELEPSMVTDWRYQEGEKLRGDFTTRVIISFMQDDDPEQAAAFLADYHENPLP